jgi:transposase
VSKVELFERIRRAWEVEGQSVRSLAREYGIHRRLVRQALQSAIPPERKRPARRRPVLTPAFCGLIEAWLQQDRHAPRKQRHTAHRVYQRLVQEHGFVGGESNVRGYVAHRKRELGLKREAYIPRDHQPGEEAEVDWYEAVVDFPSGRQTVQVFQMRACYSGREFHLAFPHQTQQAFLEAHVAAFAYFGGVFPVIRYDNLSAAVRRVLRGRKRVETERFVVLRSHYLFTPEFCQPGIAGAHEKGGVENGGGRFRRTHLVPVPHVANFAALNALLRQACLADDQRRPSGRTQTIAQAWGAEHEQLRPLPPAPLATAEVSTAVVDSKGRIRVRTNFYSVPIRLAHRRVEVRLHAQRLEAFHQGQCVATHARLYTRHGEQLVLDHYLELLRAKPGALARSRPLRSARDQGRWPSEYDQLWRALKAAYGETEGTRQFVEVLLLLRVVDAEELRIAMGLALEYGCCDPGAVRMLVRQLTQSDPAIVPLTNLGPLTRFERPVADLQRYDALLTYAEGY